MTTKNARYMILVDEKMFEETENFRFENRFKNRSEATKELIRLGIEAMENEEKDKKKEKDIKK